MREKYYVHLHVSFNQKETTICANWTKDKKIKNSSVSVTNF